LSEAERLEGEGDTYSKSAMLIEAARAYRASAHLYQEYGLDNDALRTLLRLATLDLIVGAYTEANEVIDRCLNLKADFNLRDSAMMLKGEVLDALGDDRAVVAWTQCMQKIADRVLRLLCTSHLIGGLLQRGEGGAIAQLRMTLAKAPDLKLEERIECVGAAGLSARERGKSLLAQAVYAVARHPETWSHRNAPAWQALIEQTPSLAVDLCALGSRLTLRRSNEPDHGLLMARVELVIQRIANARGLALDDLLTEITEGFDEERMLDGLLALVPDLTPR
jgi:hypothetical protein